MELSRVSSPSTSSTSSSALAATSTPKKPTTVRKATSAAAKAATSSFKSASTLSQKGLDLIKGFEGLRLTSYRDSTGVWTIGYGHTGSDVHGGQTISRARAEQLLKNDTGWAQDAVRRLVKVPLSQGQFDALTSFTFNLGAGALGSSTLLKKLNAKDYAGAQKEFGKWVHAGGVVLQGLVRRRAAEAKMFGNKAPSGSGSTTPPTKPPQPGKKIDYRVRAGDTFSGIAAKYHLSVATLKKRNPQIKNINVISVGQLIHIQTGKSSSSGKTGGSTTTTVKQTYTVRSGDTFGGIASSHHLTVAQLAKLNPQVKNINVIYPGQKLVVGTKKKPTPAPTPTPTPTPGPASTNGIPNTSGLSTAKRYAVYEKYINQFGDAQSKKDLAAGKRVILGLRQDTPMTSNQPYRGKYDDRIVVLWKDKSGPHVAEMAANTEPNRRWSIPANQSSKPVGRLADGQTVRYHKTWSTKYGDHLEPSGNPYAQRDENRDYKFEKGEKKYNGSWGGQLMYIHKAYYGDTGSQGCQTMDPGRFASFWKALGGQKDFSYVLVNCSKKS